MLPIFERLSIHSKHGNLSRFAQAASQQVDRAEEKEEGSERGVGGEEKRSLLREQRGGDNMMGGGEKMENGEREDGDVQEDKDEMPRDADGNVDQTELVRRNAEKVMKGMINWDSWHASLFFFLYILVIERSADTNKKG